MYINSCNLLHNPMALNLDWNLNDSNLFGGIYLFVIAASFHRFPNIQNWPGSLDVSVHYLD